MITFYRRKPKQCVIILFVIGLIMFVISALVILHIPERIERNLAKEIKTPEGVYEGDIQLGMVDGNGRFTWNNQDCYSGNFKDNEIDGQGKLILANGGSYNGEFQSGIRSGSGKFRWKDGKTYVGNWSNDTITGEGTVTYTNGDTLEGYFRDGIFLSGVYTTTTPLAKYRIVFEDDNVTNVKIEYTNGIVYNGEYENGSFNGEGTLVYSNGDTYKGDFVNGKKDGNGEYTWKDGARYTGEWKSDKMNGEGTYYYSSDANGYKLTGSFSDNHPTGKLQYYTDDSKSYETDWENGKCVKLTE